MMPFPLTKLPYGYRQRLRELSNPAEAYDIQIAVGNDIVGIKPLVMLRSVEGCNIINDNLETHNIELLKLTNPTDNPPTILLNVELELILFENTENFSKNPVIEKLYLKNCKKVRIKNNISSQLLQKLSHKMSPTWVELHDANMELLIPEIFSYFPNIHCLGYSKFYNGWARDLASVAKNGTNFQGLNMHARMVDVFTFDREDIVKLLKNNCSLAVDCTFPENMSVKRAFREVAKKLGPKFKVDTSTWKSIVPSFCVKLRKANELLSKSKVFVLC